jgi:hypothetical protein
LHAHYFPFIRLALARYQPHSWSPAGDAALGLHVSSIVLAEFMMLPAGRTLQASASRDVVTVKLIGPRADTRAPAPPEPVPKTARGTRPSKVHVTLEEAVLTADGSRSWVPTGVEGFGYHDTDSACTIALPHAPAAGQGRRVVVREFERYLNADHAERDRCVLIRALVV